MAAVITVVVARPLVPGEQPGLMSDFADPGGMALTFLTLFAVAGWAGWRLIQRQPALYLGWVDLAVFAVGLLAFVGAAHASYPRPSWLAGWDWLGMGLLYLLIRQLSVRPEERHGWVAVLLAGAVAMSAEGVFQAAYTLPMRTRAEETSFRANILRDDNESLHSRYQKYLRTEYVVRGLTVTPMELHQQADRLEHGRVSGPYFHPASLAAVLAMALPLAAGALLASVRGKAPPWQTGLAAVCFLLIGAALVLTKETTALVIVVQAGLAMICCVYLKRPVGLIAALVLIAAGLGGAVVMMPTAVEAWPAAWRLLQDHFWFGVGPAQFGLFYPRYMDEAAGGKLTEPGGALLDVWADAGVFGVVALLVAVALLARAVWGWASGGREPPVGTRKQGAHAPRSPAPAEEEKAPDESVNWEFYLGGMLGLVLAFILRAGTLSPEDVQSEAIVAGLRAVCWFAAFALYEGVGWTVEEHLGALVTGATAMFLCLLIHPGIGFPSVAVYLWVAFALILATVSPKPAEWLSRQIAVGLITAPAFVALAFGYFAFFFYPAAASAAALRRAQLAGLIFRGEIDKASQERSFRDPMEFVRHRMIEPAEHALKEDPDNVQLLTHLADCYGLLWQMAPQVDQFLKSSLDRALQARRVNPEGFQGYQIEDELRRRFALLVLREADRLEKEKQKDKEKEKGKDKAAKPTPPQNEVAIAQRIVQLRQDGRKQFGFAADLLEKYIPKDPNDPRLRYAIASALFGAGRESEGRTFAEQARKLDAAAKPPRNLPDQQREQIEKWLQGESKR